MVATEMRERLAASLAGLTRQLRLQDQERAPRFECCRCRHICVLSAVICPCAPGRVACVRHAAALCGCASAARMLVYWHDLDAEVAAADAAAAEAPGGAGAGGAAAAY